MLQSKTINCECENVSCNAEEQNVCEALRALTGWPMLSETAGMSQFLPVLALCLKQHTLSCFVFHFGVSYLSI